jgi:DNA gyrase subunit B
LTFFYRQMFHLVEGGHIYVAQPPLFRVKAKKDTYYVQTEEEMRDRLLKLGLRDAVFEPGEGREVKGEQMERLVRMLAPLEDALVALERRGIGLRAHAQRQDAAGKLPVYHVFLGREEKWFTRREDLDAFVAQQEKAAGAELHVAETSTALNPSPPTAHNGSGSHADTGNGEGTVHGGIARSAKQLHIVELHEVRSINAALEKLKEMGFDIQSLIPQERTGREDSRYTLRRGEQSTGIEDLRGLVAAVRAAGERGLHITRFKGLGEMNAEELRDTTLHPANRTLLQVTMEDASAADSLFRVLMGDKVEPRREFIEKHALEVKNLDV